MTDVRSTILGLWPNARITSGYRSPSSRLGRANPRSYHNLGSPTDPHAYDVAPIPGVSYADYIKGLKGAGIDLLETRDEQAHPLPWTTGPNWHTAFNPQGQSNMLQPRKPKAKPNQAPLQMAEAPMPDMAQGSLAPTDDTLSPLVKDIPKVGKGGIFGSGLNGWDLVGILGDSYLEANGKDGVYLPAKQQHQQDQYDREKWSAILEQKRQEALAPPQQFQNADYYNNLPKPDQQRYLGAQDAMNPIVADIVQPDGSVRRSVIPRGGMSQAGPQPGAEEDGYIFMGGDPANPQNWRPR